MSKPIITKGRRAMYLPVETAVYVPSTNKDKPIPAKQFSNRVEEVRTYLSQKFGGYTSVSAVGGYYDGTKVVKEKVVKVTAFTTQQDWKNNKGKLVGQLSTWQRKYKQDSIGFEHEGDLYYIKSREREINKAAKQQTVRAARQQTAAPNSNLFASMGFPSNSTVPKRKTANFLPKI
jgi:hypothetical protein